MGVFAAESPCYGHPGRETPALGICPHLPGLLLHFFSPRHLTSMDFQSCALSRGYCTQLPLQLL